MSSSVLPIRPERFARDEHALHVALPLALPQLRVLEQLPGGQLEVARRPIVGNRRLLWRNAVAVLVEEREDALADRAAMRRVRPAPLRGVVGREKRHAAARPQHAVRLRPELEPRLQLALTPDVLEHV